MRHFKLFEEFNPYTGKVLIEKMKLYAEASEYVAKITPVVSEDDKLSFKIITKIPAEFETTGTKTFKIIVPTNADKPYVETYENDKLVLTTSIEIKGEDDVDLILINYIEATQLYDDSIAQAIVDKHDKIKTIQDIRHIIAQCNSSYDKKYLGH